MADGDDLLLTLVHADGTIETRSAKADLDDPVRKVLGRLISYGGQDLENALFPDGQAREGRRASH